MIKRSAFTVHSYNTIIPATASKSHTYAFYAMLLFEFLSYCDRRLDTAFSFTPAKTHQTQLKKMGRGLCFPFRNHAVDRPFVCVNTVQSAAGTDHRTRTCHQPAGHTEAESSDMHHSMAENKECVCAGRLKAASAEQSPPRAESDRLPAEVS